MANFSLSNVPFIAPPLFYFIYFKKILIYLCIHLAALGLSCGTRDLYLRHAGSLLEACELLVVARGIQFPDQALNLGSLHWERTVLAIGSPGKSLHHYFNTNPRLQTHYFICKYFRKQLLKQRVYTHIHKTIII